MKTYAWAMGVRTISFPLAAWALVSGWHVVGWVLAVAAIGLPSVAVMMANATDRRRTPAAGPASPRRALPAGGAQPLSGRVVDDEPTTPSAP